MRAELQDAAAKVCIDGIYRHYKGHEYVVRGFSVLESNNVVAVRYAPLDYPDVEFVRSIDLWMEKVMVNDREFNRFTAVN